MNIDRPSCEKVIWFLDETCHVVVDWTVQNHNQKPNRLVCICFSMMSFVFAPVVKNKPNLPNAFTSMTLSTTPHPPPQKKEIMYVSFFIYLFLFLFFHYYYFLLGFSLRCEPKVTRDFSEVTKMAHEGKAPVVFCYNVHINFKRRKVICSHTLEIKLPRQLTTLNVKGAACDLFDVFMGINHRKYSSYSLKLCSFLW